METKIKEVIREYDPKNICIGVLGSHSALEIASGAKQEGFETVVVCQKGRDKTYTKYYPNLFDHIMLLEKFADMTSPSNVKKITDLNTVFVPNRSFSVYAGYENIEEKFTALESIFDLYIKKDILEFLHIDNIRAIKTMLSLLAMNNGQICNFSSLIQDIGIDIKTFKVY